MRQIRQSLKIKDLQVTKSCSCSKAGSGGSDRRIKTDISAIGKSPSGIPIYKFKYKRDIVLAGGRVLDSDSTFVVHRTCLLLDIAPDAVVVDPVVLEDRRRFLQDLRHLMDLLGLKPEGRNIFVDKDECSCG